jgi:hypothetical protein
MLHQEVGHSLAGILMEHLMKRGAMGWEFEAGVCHTTGVMVLRSVVGQLDLLAGVSGLLCLPLPDYSPLRSPYETLNLSICRSVSADYMSF